jgi:hypothetical protein
MGNISFLCSFENLLCIVGSRIRKTIQAIKRRIIVRLTGESSSNPIFINGNAKAQKTIGIPIIKKKYFFANTSFFLL